MHSMILDSHASLQLQVRLEVDTLMSWCVMVHVCGPYVDSNDALNKPVVHKEHVVLDVVA